MTDQSETNSTTLVERLNPAETIAVQFGAGAIISEQYRAIPSDLGLDGQMIEGPNRPDAVAVRIINCWRERGWHFVYWRQRLMVYNALTNGAYVQFGNSDEKETLASAVQMALENARFRAGDEDRDWDPTPTSVDNVVKSIVRRIMLSDDVDSQSWINKMALDYSCDEVDRRFPGEGLGDLLFAASGDDLIPCKSGILWLAYDYDAGIKKRIMLPHTPGFFSTHAVDCYYDPDADDGWGGGGEPARWLRFLNDVWGEDPDSIMTAQEVLGYNISGSTELEVLFTATGPGGAGKGTLAGVLTALMGGAQRVYSPTLTQLSKGFGLASAMDKSLMLIRDARVSINNGNVVEIILAISGRDPVSVDRKHKDQVERTLHCRIFIMSNKRIVFHDDSRAMLRRLVPLVFKNEFNDRADPRLKTDIVRYELTGIFHWTLDGWERLRDRIDEGRRVGQRPQFTLGEWSRSELDKLREDMAPVETFLKDWCEFGAYGSSGEARTFFEPTAVLHEAYIDWARLNGQKASHDVRQFGEAIGSAADALKLTSARDTSGARLRGWRGLRLVKNQHTGFDVG